VTTETVLAIPSLDTPVVTSDQTKATISFNLKTTDGYVFVGIPANSSSAPT